MNQLAAAPGQPTEAPRDRVAVVVNGNAKQVTEGLVTILDQIVASGDLFVSRDLEEGKQIARTIVERGYPTVLTGGGDGTFVQMVTWIVREATRRSVPTPRFGLLRLGTGNALAWVLGARSHRDRGVVTDLARLRKSAGSRELRLLEVEGALTPFAGLGIDAVALQHFNETRDALARIPLVSRFATGGVSYFLSILGRSMPEYLIRSHTRVRVLNRGAAAVRLGVDGEPVGAEIGENERIYEGPCRMVCMSTIPYWGFGARIFPFANEREDRFSLRVVDIGPLDVGLHLRKIWKGTFRSDRVHDFLVERVAIEFDTPQPFQVGGDGRGTRQALEAAMGPPIRVVDHYSPPTVESIGS